MDNTIINRIDTILLTNQTLRNSKKYYDDICELINEKYSALKKLIQQSDYSEQYKELKRWTLYYAPRIVYEAPSDLTEWKTLQKEIEQLNNLLKS